MASDNSAPRADLFLWNQTEWKRFFRRGPGPWHIQKSEHSTWLGAFVHWCGLYVKRTGSWFSEARVSSVSGTLFSSWWEFVLISISFQNSSHGYKIKRDAESLRAVLYHASSVPSQLSWESHPHTELLLTPVVPVKAKIKNGKDELESISRWTHQRNSVAGRGQSSLGLKKPR